MVVVDTPERFTLRVQQDGSVHVEIGHAFSENDIPSLVTAQQLLTGHIPAPRLPGDSYTRA